MDASEVLLATRKKRCRAEDLRLTLVAAKARVTGHAVWRDSEMKARWHVYHASPAGGLGLAIPARTADECDEASGQEFLGEEEKSRGGLARAAGGREPARQERFKAF